MKKPIKHAVYALIVVLGTLALIFLLVNYVFTTKLSLSCSGKETTSIFLGEKVTPIEIKDKLEGVSITATKYPFKNHHLSIASENVYIISGTKGELTAFLDTQILGTQRTTTEDADIYRSISFNRLTRAIEIEKIYKFLTTASGTRTKFEGVCTEVKTL